VTDIKTTLTVRPARAEEAAIGAELIHLSGPELLAYTLSNNERRLKTILVQAFSKPHHLLSYEYAHFALVEGDILGLVLAYSGADEKRAIQGSIRTFLSILGFREILTSLRRAFVFRQLSSHTPRDELYISNLAVLSRAQGQNIGSHLLDWVEDHCRARGLARCSLDVVIENVRARALYERKGFVVKHTRTSRFTKQVGITGVHRMTKVFS